MQKIAFAAIAAIVLWSGILSALTVVITNDNADMINSKKICVRVSFEPEEVALYKDTLCISVDTSELELIGWRTVAQAPAIYVASFKKSKKLFTEPFTLEILIDFESNDKQYQASVLNGACLSVSSLVLTKRGKNKAENVIVPLKVVNLAEDLVPTVEASSVSLLPEYTSTLLPYQRSFECFNQHKRLVGKNDLNEVLIIDRVKELWHDLHIKMGAWICSFSFYKWYIALWILLTVLLLYWLYPVVRLIIPLSTLWHRELFVWGCIILFLCTWWLGRGYIRPYVWYATLSFLCVPASLYYLWGGTDTVLERCKVLVGIVFAVAILPLLVLAYIHGNFEVLLRYLK